MNKKDNVAPQCAGITRICFYFNPLSMISILVLANKRYLLVYNYYNLDGFICHAQLVVRTETGWTPLIVTCLFTAI